MALSLATSDGLFGAPDWVSLGLILCIVGCFLLANGILFRDPRGLVEERFGRQRLALRSIRAFIFHRVQMTIGFTFLLLGFASQLYGRLNPATSGAEGASPALWIGVVLLAAIGLEVGGWWWSTVLFRSHLRSWFRDHPPDFATDTHLAQEVGELFGVASHADDTVQSYVERLHREVGLGRRRIDFEPEPRSSSAPTPEEELLQGEAGEA